MGRGWRGGTLCPNLSRYMHTSESISAPPLLTESLCLRERLAIRRGLPCAEEKAPLVLIRVPGTGQVNRSRSVPVALSESLHTGRSVRVAPRESSRLPKGWGGVGGVGRGGLPAPTPVPLLRSPSSRRQPTRRMTRKALPPAALPRSSPRLPPRRLHRGSPAQPRWRRGAGHAGPGLASGGSRHG